MLIQDDTNNRTAGTVMVQIVAEGSSSKDVAAVWHISLGKKRQRKQAAKDSNDRVKTN